MRIGTNREFAHRILAPELKQIMTIFPNTFITIVALERGTENALLNGQIDIGIDCERPNDPEIGYHLVLDEPIVAVCSADFYRKHKSDILQEKLDVLPHLLCDRLNPDRIFLHQENNMTVVAQFNDVAATRAACLSGVGWALLPKYAVSEELELKTLRLMSEKKFGKSKYGIWWPRSRGYLKGSVAKLRKWLEEKKL